MVAAMLNPKDCTHSNMTADMNICPDCGFECEHDRENWYTTDEGLGYSEFWGQIVNEVALVTRCRRDEVVIDVEQTNYEV